MEVNETKKMSTESSCSSAANKVGSCDDLMTDILLRLPVRSVLQFMSVSKHSYSLVSSHSFKILYSRRIAFTGLFVPVYTNSLCIECEYVPFDIQEPVKPLHIRIPEWLDPNDVRVYIEDSSNGLILCFSRNKLSQMYNGVLPIMYYVYNPTINQCVTLPSLGISNPSLLYGMTLAFDPLKSPHYKIINVYNFRVRSYQIQIYSSDTRAFKLSHAFSLDYDICNNFFSRGVYWNNAIHWVHRSGFVLYFDLDEEIMHEIQTPFALLGLDHKGSSNYIFESRDHLLLAEIHGPQTFKFKIHELKKDYSGWFVKYHVDLEEVRISFLQSRLAFETELNVLCIVLGEKEDDLFLVLGFDRKVVRFDLVSKKFQKLYSVLVGKVRNVYKFGESLYSV